MPPQPHVPLLVRVESQNRATRGLRLIGQGREAEVFVCQDGRVLKLLRGAASTSLAREIAALDAARSAGVCVPQAYEEVVLDGRPGLMMERLAGADLLTIIGQKPWRVFHSGRLTGEIHARINAARAPASLPAVKDVVTRGLARLAPVEPTLAEWVGRILARLPDGDALCHGDFHPGQVMSSGDRYAAFDWSGAKRGDPLFDYARTRVVISIGAPPPGTELTLRLLAKVGRRVLLSSYARAYERQTSERIDQARVRHWEIVNLAARVLDEVPGERPRLLQRLQKEFARRAES
jgi:tRNA A-37 threonylcarbamoyl transferase component Bud32